MASWFKALVDLSEVLFQWTWVRFTAPTSWLTTSYNSPADSGDPVPFSGLLEYQTHMVHGHI